MEKKQKKGILLPFKGPPKQPKRCKGCVWGRWDGRVEQDYLFFWIILRKKLTVSNIGDTSEIIKIYDNTIYEVKREYPFLSGLIDQSVVMAWGHVRLQRFIF
ncbi:hypothetical protein [Paenibacillus kribbensis]|uniref:hypothetical protein n=1 Tax=Paenibacillus kribbensis TaxID=172713 RepID=UPI00159EF6F6|nr:hypothetical protein [Paenibacillus kribbensis]